MTLAEKFADAQLRVKALKSAPATDQLLQLYALYKQGTSGDVQGARPGMMDFKSRAKYDAWAAQKNTPREKAMEAYVALVDKLV